MDKTSWRRLYTVWIIFSFFNFLAQAHADVPPVYFKLFYKGTYVGEQKISDAFMQDKTTISLPITNILTTINFPSTISTDLEVHSPYILHGKAYKPGFSGGGAALGFFFPRFRVEIEGLKLFDIIPHTKSTSKHEKASTIYLPDIATCPPEEKRIVQSKNFEGDINNISCSYKKFINQGFNYQGAFLTFYYDLEVPTNLVPYIGASVGYGQIKIKEHDKKYVGGNGLALQGKIGVSYATKNVWLPYLAYSFLYLPKLKLKPGLQDTCRQSFFAANITTLLHNIEIGFMIPI